LTFLGLLTIIGVFPSRAVPQTAATGALIGEVLDPTGKGIPGASVELKNQEMAASRSTVSDEEGRFVFTLLPPEVYQLIVQKEGYSQAKSAVSVSVTETTRLSIPLKIAGMTQSVQVHANVSGVQTDSAALKRVVDGNMVTSQPLVTRNYTQIAVLSPGQRQRLQCGRGGKRRDAHFGRKIQSHWGIRTRHNSAGAGRI
jgi:hypothetical protein